MISTVIITKNEADMIAGCLESVTWCDDIVIVDDYSTDDTRDISKKYKVRIFEKKFKGFASQKTYGISKAKHNWILILDADERASLLLKEQIQDMLSNQNTTCVAYEIPFINYFLARRMNYGGWQNEFHVRLFDKRKAQYLDQEIHEQLDADDNICRLSGPIYHFSHRDISSNLLKTKLYAEWDAHYHYHRNSPPVTRWKLLTETIQHFWQRYIIQRGYKDGMEGFIEAMYQAFSYVFIIQSMLWEKQRGTTSQELYQQLDQKLKKNDFNLEPIDRPDDPASPLLIDLLQTVWRKIF